MASGILNVNKPLGPSSFSIVRRLKRLPGVQKVGHGGTLDPAADGVLPILINSATRLADFVHGWPKAYSAGVTFGAVSDTDDREGTITRAGNVEHLTAEHIRALLPSFTGQIRQIPPRYSALKRAGEAMYHKARRGEPMELPARPVEIEAILLREYDRATGTAQLDVVCGRGTYIRGLARDLGSALGCGGYLSSLTRVAVGPLTYEAALTTEQLTGMGEKWINALLPLDLPVRDWPAMVLDRAGVAAVRHGQTLPAPSAGDGRYRLVTPEGEMVGWGEAAGSVMQPRAVFAE